MADEHARMQSNPTTLVYHKGIIFHILHSFKAKVNRNLKPHITELCDEVTDWLARRILHL